MAYGSVLFDVDGTLLDTSEGILAATRRVISDEGLEMPPLSTMLSFIGPPIQDSFKRVYGCSADEADRLAARFRAYYREADYLLQARPYDGIFQVMDALRARDVRIGIATYKRQDYAEEILRHFGFDAYTPYLFGSDLEGALKKSDIIANCLAAMDVADRRDALMVGDTAHDALGAQKLGVPFLAVSFGFGFAPGHPVEGFEAVGVAATPLEILDYV